MICENETGVSLHVRGKPLPKIIRNGVAIADRNGGSVEVIITVPSLPANLGRASRARRDRHRGSAKWAQQPQNSAFKADGWKPVRAHPDDRDHDIDVEVEWAASAPAATARRAIRGTPVSRPTTPS